jgi:hypothetical protein
MIEYAVIMRRKGAVVKPDDFIAQARRAIDPPPNSGTMLSLQHRVREGNLDLAAKGRRADEVAKKSVVDVTQDELRDVHEWFHGFSSSSPALKDVEYVLVRREISAWEVVE